VFLENEMTDNQQQQNLPGPAPSPGMGRLARLAWLPIPCLLLVIILLWLLQPLSSFDSPLLVLTLNFLTRTAASLFVLFLAGRGFLLRGEPGLLLLGCGVMAWCASGIVGSLPYAWDANIGVTVTNLGIWLAALCHLSGVVVSLRSSRIFQSRGLLIGAAYLSVLGLVGLIWHGSFANWFALFFVDGQGGTTVRQVVLGSALSMFVFTMVLLREENRLRFSRFGYWYLLALLLISVGIFGMMLQSSRVSALNWACRAAQYLSGIYMLIAAMAAAGQEGGSGIILGRPTDKRYNWYGVAAATVIAATAVRLVLLQLMGNRYGFLTFYPAVMLSALYGGLWAGLLTTALSALAYIYFFIPPVGRWLVTSAGDWVALGIFFLSGALLSFMVKAMDRAHDRAHQAELRACAAEREQAAKAVRESEERLRSVLRSTSMGAFEIDFETGGWHWNDAEFQLLGLQPGEAPTSPEFFFQYVHAEDLGWVRAKWEEALRTGELDIEFRIVRADGKVRWLAGKGWLVFDDEAAGRPVRFMGLNFDITRRKNTELDLVTTQQRLQAIMQAVPVGISYSNDASCHSITGNPAVLAQFGVEQEDNLSASAVDRHAPGRQVLFFRNGERITDADLPLQRAVAEKRIIEPMEIEVELPDGRRWFAEGSGAPIRDQDGEVIGGVAVTVDITNRKLAEEQLRELTQRLSYHIDNSPLAVIEWGPDMLLTRWSAAAESMFGWTADEVLGKRMEDFRWIYEEDEARVAEVSGILQDGSNLRQFSANRNYHKDGSIIYCEWFNSSLLDASGNLRSILSLVLNVSRRVQLEKSLQQHAEMLEARVIERTAELRERDRMLLQQSRLAAMGEMINNIAHQWRQPLNILGLNIQSLSLFYDFGTFNKEFLDTTTKDAMKLIHHMSQTIDDFRNFFKPDKQKVEFCVNKAIRQTVGLVSDSFKHHKIGVTIRTDGEAMITGYPNEFSQVLMNILQNAREALLEQKSEGRRVNIASSVENRRTVITIADNAGGITQDIIDRVFEPYFTTKGAQGTGIGLYMSKVIIEKNMGGSLSVRNVEGGAQFRIEV
jgi:PAS domain S-box-containing protein